MPEPTENVLVSQHLLVLKEYYVLSGADYADSTEVPEGKGKDKNYQFRVSQDLP